MSKLGLTTLKELLAESDRDLKARQELEAANAKVPIGMFSPLDEAIQAQPFDVAPAQQWLGAVKPGTMVTRGGTNFPVKQEELDFTGLARKLQELHSGQGSLKSDPKPGLPGPRNTDRDWEGFLHEHDMDIEDPAVTPQHMLNLHEAGDYSTLRGQHQMVFDRMMMDKYAEHAKLLGHQPDSDDKIDVLTNMYGEWLKERGLPQQSADELVGNANTSLAQDEWLHSFSDHWDRVARGREVPEIADSSPDNPNAIRKADLLTWLRQNRMGIETKQQSRHGNYTPPYLQTGAYPNVTRLTDVPSGSAIDNELSREQHFDNALSWNRGAQLTNPQGLDGRLVVEVQSDPHRRASDLIGTPPPDLISQAQALLDHPSTPEELRNKVKSGLTEQVMGTRTDENPLPGWTTRRRGYGVPDPDQEGIEQPVSEDLPFQGVKGYGALELKKALNQAVAEDSRFLALASGKDQEDIYKSLSGRQIKGMHAVYDPMFPKVDKKTGVEKLEPGIYAQVLRGLAKQYNIPYTQDFPIAANDRATPSFDSSDFWQPPYKRGDPTFTADSAGHAVEKHVSDFMDKYVTNLGDETTLTEPENERILKENTEALNELFGNIYHLRRAHILPIEKAWEADHLSDDDMAAARAANEKLKGYERELDFEPGIDDEDLDPLSGVPDAMDAANEMEHILRKGHENYKQSGQVGEDAYVRRQALEIPESEKDRLMRTGISPWMLAGAGAGLGAMGAAMQQPADAETPGFARGSLVSLKQWINRNYEKGVLDAYRGGENGNNTQAYRDYLAKKGFNPRISEDDFEGLMSVIQDGYAGLDYSPQFSRLIKRHGIEPPRDTTLGRGLNLDPGDHLALKWPDPQAFSTNPKIYRQFGDLSSADRYHDVTGLHLLMDNPPPGFKMLPIPMSGEDEWVMPGNVQLKEVGSGINRRFGEWMNVKPTKWSEGGEVPGYAKGGLELIARARNSKDALKAIKALPPADLARATQLLDLAPGLDKYMSTDAVKHYFPSKGQWPIAVLDPQEFREFAMPGEYDEEWNKKVDRISKSLDKHGLVDYPVRENRYNVAVPGLLYEPGSPIRRQPALDIQGHEGRHRADVFEDKQLKLPTVMIGQHLDPDAWDNWAKNLAPPKKPLQTALSYLNSVKKVRPEVLTYAQNFGPYMDPHDLRQMLNDAQVNGGVGPFDVDLSGRVFAKGGLAQAADWKKPKSWKEAYDNRASLFDRASSQLESELSYWDDKTGEPRYLFGPETDEEKSGAHVPRGWHINDLRLINDLLGLPSGLSDLAGEARDWAASKLRTPKHDTIHTLRNLIAGKIATDEKTDPLHTEKTSITPETDRLLELSKQHSDRGTMIRDAVMMKNGVAPPVDPKERGADIFGEMAGQLPIPAAWLRGIRGMRGLGGPLGAVSEYLGPTVSSPAGYLMGTAGGIGLGEGLRALGNPEEPGSDLAP